MVDYKQNRRDYDHWSLDKRVPLGLVFAVIIQSAAFVWWGATTFATTNARLNTLETWVQKNDQMVQRTIRLETKMENIEAGVARIEEKLDKRK